MIYTQTTRTRRKPRNRTVKLPLPLVISLACTFTPRATQAQVKPFVVPTPVQEMAYMRAGPYFYVQGSKAVRNRVDYLITPQFYALDISTYWTTDSPLWKALSGGPAYNLFNGVASPDNKTLTTLFQQQFAQLLVNQYSIDMNTWTNTLVQTSENLMGIRPVMDPISGLVYIAGQASIVVLDPRTMAPKFFPIANTTILSRSFPGAVYHPGRKSILYLGGFTPASVFESGTYVTEHIIATNTWSSFMAEGVLPTVRADHCMAINEDGSKIVVFGGRIPIAGSTSETSFTGTLYILDVVTRIWTLGQGSSPRLYMACTIVGDQLIAWGGFDDLNTIDGPPIVYSLSTNTWINSHTAPAHYASSARPTSGATNGTSPSPPDSSSSSSSNLGSILGGTLGSLCLLAFAAVVYLLLKRRTDKAKYKALAQQLQQQQQRTSSQTDILYNLTTSCDGNDISLQLYPTPTTRSSTAKALVDVSRMSSQYNPAVNNLVVVRNPQDEGDRNHTIDYDPIGYTKVNPHHLFPSNMKCVYYVPQVSRNVSGYHYPVPTQSSGSTPIYAQARTPTDDQSVFVQPVNFDPTLHRQQQEQLQQQRRYGAK